MSGVVKLILFVILDQTNGIVVSLTMVITLSLALLTILSLAFLLTMEINLPPMLSAPATGLPPVSVAHAH
jgi:hypothetical protein